MSFKIPRGISVIKLVIIMIIIVAYFFLKVLLETEPETKRTEIRKQIRS